MVVRHKKENTKKTPKPLIKLTVIVVPTVIVVVLTLVILYFSGLFLTPEQKIEGDWERTRVGEYSFMEYKENYSFWDSGNGIKTYTDNDGETLETEFTWCITEKKTLVINGHVKYYWNPQYADYYDNSAKTAKKYWYVSKRKLYLGEDTSAKYEMYEKVE